MNFEQGFRLNFLVFLSLSICYKYFNSMHADFLHSNFICIKCDPFKKLKSIYTTDCIGFLYAVVYGNKLNLCKNIMFQH